MLPAVPPPPPAQIAALNPRTMYFTGRLSQKRYLPCCGIRVSGLSFPPKKTLEGEEILPNAFHLHSHPYSSDSRFSLGVDLGASRTGLALGKGFFPRPLTVLELRGIKLEKQLLKIAELEEVDEFIIGLPKSRDGRETTQSNKVRCIAGRLAVQAAERGWRVYLQNEFGTSLDALDVMIERGVKKSARRVKIDAYSALMLLERYFSTSGSEAELVLPKKLDLQEKVLRSIKRRDLLHSQHSNVFNYISTTD